MRRFAVALAFAGALTASPVLAADKAGPPASVAAILPPAPAVAPSCYAQVLAGSSINSVKADKDILPVSLSASGWTVGAGIGCDVKIERIVIGALARIELPVDTDGTWLKTDQSWMAAARFGYMINTGLMAYGLVGYAQSDWKIDVEKLDRHGLVLGGGIEVMISKHLSLTAEYTRTGLGSISTDPLIKLEPVNHSARLGLSYRFNSLFGMD